MKKGSLQQFVYHHDVAGNYGSGLFSVKEVHKIGILDIRILNCDRNENNILIERIKKPHTVSLKMIPIDHGLSLPDCIEIKDYEIAWMNWPQSHEPFTLEEIEHIECINIKKDLEVLRRGMNLREKCERNFVAVNMLLKLAGKLGFNLYEIGSLVYRLEEDQPSFLQSLLKKTKEIYKLMSTADFPIFKKTFSGDIKDINNEDIEEKLERLSTNDEQIEVLLEKIAVGKKRENKRRMSNPEIKRDYDKKMKKKELGVRKGRYNERFFCYFEQFLKQELEKRSIKGRIRYSSSEMP